MRRGLPSLSRSALRYLNYARSRTSTRTELGWFPEDFDTPVLQDAKALLDELM
jgi:hypothetical protein